MSTEERELDAPRGSIVDRERNTLAISTQRYSLYANPRMISSSWEIARLLEPLIELSAPEIYTRLQQDRYFVWLERKLDDRRAQKMGELDVPGLGLVPEYERIYPNEELAAHVLGFVGLDNYGLEGVERQFDDFLSGGDKEFQDLNLVLTIDQTIQHYLEEELRRMVRASQSKSAMGVVMEPNTGEVLAMANVPGFDPNQYEKKPEELWRNRAIADPVEPGSTFKVMTIGSAMAAGDVDSDSTFNCPGHQHFSNADYTLRCYAKHGDIDLPEILIKSCNVGTAKAIEQMDREDFYRHLRRFGFGNRTGIELPGEARGTLRRPARWSAITQPSVAIGQGVSATALQEVTALSAAVNGGKLIKPRIMKAKEVSGEENEVSEVTEVRRVLEAETAAELRKYMRGVVSRGTGRAAASNDFKLAGKTGTAQKADLEEGGYHEDKVMASFIGFGPVEKPALAVNIIANEPQKGRYGGEVAGPAFKRVMERSLKYLNLNSNR